MLRPILDGMYLDEIDKATVRRVVARARTNATRRRDLTAMSVVMDFAAEHSMCARNVVVDYDRRRIRETRLPPVLPTDTEVDRFADACPQMLGWLVRLLEHTGMRLEEAATLTWRQVDMPRRAIMLERTKNQQARSIEINDAAAAVLRAVTRHTMSPWVFWHGQESPKPYGKASQRLAGIRKANGIGWPTHMLRHLYAIRELRAGRSLYRIKAQLGHSSIAVTEIYLAHLTPEEAERARAVSG